MWADKIRNYSIVLVKLSLPNGKIRQKLVQIGSASGPESNADFALQAARARAIAICSECKRLRNRGDLVVIGWFSITLSLHDEYTPVQLTAQKAYVTFTYDRMNYRLWVRRTVMTVLRYELVLLNGIVRRCWVVRYYIWMCITLQTLIM